MQDESFYDFQLTSVKQKKADGLKQIAVKF